MLREHTVAVLHIETEHYICFIFFFRRQEKKRNDHSQSNSNNVLFNLRQHCSLGSGIKERCYCIIGALNSFFRYFIMKERILSKSAMVEMRYKTLRIMTKESKRKAPMCSYNSGNNPVRRYNSCSTH